uniref:Mitochondrial dicarboxylate carrier (Trinotate prediction) n=1 Tax=Myxobolus squamalis TaxID=59785 RepID=A0A6B2G184_MYXSQ
MSGYQMTASRGCLMTVGQIAFYEQFKQLLINYKIMKDGVQTHLICSSLAAVTACFITQPIDVIKALVMNSKDSSIIATLKSTRNEGAQAFFKGLVPAFVRLAPHTILTFVFLEQLKKMFTK